jgi:phosphosulfolactate synthase
MAATLDFLNVPQRSRKPRSSGLTLTRDQGFSPRQVDDLMGTFGEFIDYVKIKQFELFYQPAELTRAKVAAYRKHAVKTFCGGTVVEAAIIRGQVERTMQAVRALGLDAIEISDNILDLDLAQKKDLVKKARNTGFEVLLEYGKKYGDDPIDVDAAAADIEALLEAGAGRIILERSQLDSTLGPDGKSATAGRIDELVQRIGMSSLVFEAETIGHMLYLINRFGPDVNLGPNIAAEFVASNLEPARCGLGRAEGYSFFEKLRK